MEDELEVKQPITLDSPMPEVEDRLLGETNINELKDIINIFNLNLQKKNIVRLGKLNTLQDLITEQMESRIKNKADEFNNQDLLNYFKTVQETISKTDSSLDKIDTPSIQVTQNQLNINVNNDELDRDSRERIMDAVKAILSKAEKDPAQLQEIIQQEEEVIDIDFIQEESQ